MPSWAWEEVDRFVNWDEYNDFRVWLIEQTKAGIAYQIAVPDWYQHFETIGIHWYYKPDNDSVWELSDPDPPGAGGFSPVPREKIIGELALPPHLAKNIVILPGEVTQEKARYGKREEVVVLVQIEADDLSSRICASFDSDGDLVLAGQDIGDYVKERLGRDEYEYALIVPASSVSSLAEMLAKHVGVPPGDDLASFVLNSLKSFFSDHKIMTTSGFQRWLNANNIPSQNLVR